MTDRVLAIINDEVITQSELDARFAARLASGAVGDPKALAYERRRELRNMAFQLLFTQAARRLKIEDAQIDAGVKERVAKAEREAGGAAALRRIIQSQGKSFVDWEREQRADELAERLQMAEIGFEARPEREIVITPTVLRSYYHEHLDDFRSGPSVKGQEILLTDARVGSHEKALAKGRQILEAIAEGADFSNLAREHSEWRPAYGGSLGWIERGRGVDKAIEDFLFSNPAGTVSGLLEQESAVVIVKVAETRGAGVRPFTDPETQLEISRKLQNEQRRKLLDGLTERLALEAYVWPTDLFLR